MQDTSANLNSNVKNEKAKSETAQKAIQQKI